MSLSRRLANLGKAIDSATTGHFLSKGDSDGLFETIQYTDLTGRPTVLDSANITAIVDSAYIQLRQTVAGSGGLDSAAITTLVDSAYVSARSPAASSGFAAYEYNTSAAQTTFQDSDVNGNVLSYSANGIIVYYNGVLMPTSDYTATDGSSVVFTTAVDSGGTVTIAKWALASSGGSGGSSFTWGGDRAVIGGGINASSTRVNTLQYVTIASTGNTTDFGDLNNTANLGGSASNSTYGLFAGGVTPIIDVIDYITISTPSNATDFGDLTVARFGISGCGDGTYALFGGGHTSGNTIDYVTVASPSNASDFGDLTVSVYTRASCNDATYGVWAGGDAYTNVIDYVTMATPSNASDFGDLTAAIKEAAGCSDTTRGVITGGNNSSGARLVDIQYITIATTSNATDLSDLSAPRSTHAACSDNTYGLYSGGVDLSAYTNSMDYSTIQSSSNATDFGDLLQALSGPTACSGSPS